MNGIHSDTQPRPGQTPAVAVCAPGPEVEALVREMIGRVADKWTMLILEELSEHRVLRFGVWGVGAAGRCFAATIRSEPGKALRAARGLRP